VAAVDVDDLDEVVDLIGDRLLEMQVDEGLPVYVTPLRPIECVIALLQEQAEFLSSSQLPIA
jgi:hypothetical protein